MPCSDSSSGLNIKLDQEERFVKFEFAKITCSQEISAQTGYSDLCKGKTLEEVLETDYLALVDILGFQRDDEKKFILYLEWEALRAGIVQYLGIERKEIDCERCQITAIEHTSNGVEISEVILPPKELPKILACGMVDRKDNQ